MIADAPVGIEEKTCFIGIGFSVLGVPIEVVGIHLVGLETGRYAIFLTDDFQRINGVPEQDIQFSLNRAKSALEKLSQVYSFEPELILASDLMSSREYRTALSETRERIADLGMRPKLLDTVPEKFRGTTAEEYPLNELACTEFLRRQGFGVKLGPPKERQYDSVMQALGMEIEFAYLDSAFALGTPEPVEVVHYIPGHRGSGQRLLLEDPPNKASTKLILGPDEACRYLLRVASVAAERLGREALKDEEISFLSGRYLKKATRRLVTKNILEPYRRAYEM